MLPSGRPLKLGSYEFDLDERASNGSPYTQSFPPRDGTRPDIPGRPGDRNLEQTAIFWGRDDWSGGEGGLKFDSQDPAMFYQGTVNPRVQGQLTGPPPNTATSYATGTTQTGPFLVNSQGYIWLFGDNDSLTSTDGVTWTNSNDGIAAGEVVTSACGDSTYCYIWTTDTPNGAGNVEIRRLQAGGVNAAFLNGLGPNINDNRVAVLENYVYTWNSNKLRRYDTTGVLPYVAQPPAIFSLGTDNSPPSGTIWNILATDDSVVFFNANAGFTQVFEYKNGAGTKIWNGEPGFTARAMGFSLGVLYLAGTYNNKAALFGMSMQERDPQFIGYLRKDSTLQPTSLAPGHGPQLLIGTLGGKVFVYDALDDAISLLDDCGASSLNAVGTYKNLRIGALDLDATHWKTFAWSDDDAATTVSGNLTETFYDMGLPEERKALLGVHVFFKPISGAETITVSYKLDEGASFVDLTQITSASTDAFGGTAATGRIYLDVASSNIRFTNLRLKYSWTGGATIYSVTPRSTVINYQGRWDVAIRIEDDPRQAVRAGELYDYLFHPTTGIVPTRQVFTLLDGRPYPDTNHYQTYTVRVLDAQFTSDRSERDREATSGSLGTANLTLLSVSP